jgi:drug/metabolite transporter (DMT)-like permease
MTEPRPALGVVAAFAVVVMWSSFLLMSRFGLKTEMAPVDMAALRFGVSGAVMLPVLLWRGFGGLDLARAAFLAVTGGLGFALWIYMGFARAPAAYGAILLPGMLPLYTTILAWLVLGDRVTPARVLPLVLIVTGVAALAIGTIQAGDPARLLGAAFFLLGSFMWSCFTIALRRWRVEAMQATAIVAVLAAAAYLPIYLVALPVGLSGLPWSTLVAQAMVQGVVAVILALLAFATAVKHLGPTATTMITGMTPAVVTLAAVPLLDEPLTPFTALGAAAVVAGSILTARAASKRLPTTATAG